MELFNADCFDILPEIKDKSVNMFLLDLPYNQTNCKWDKEIINLEKMWVEIKRIMKPNAIIVFFTTAKFGYRLIHSNPKWFRYDLIWKKSRKVGFLSANKMPLRQHENIYVFKDEQGTYNPQKTKGKPYNTKARIETECVYKNKEENYKRTENINKGDRHPTSVIEHENIYVFGNDNKDDLENIRNKDLRAYAQKVKDYIGKGVTQINKDMKNTKAQHFFGMINSSQFGIPTETTYNKLIELYRINEMSEFIEHDKLKNMWEKEKEPTYNPQKTEGTSYKCKQGQQTNLYGIKDKANVITENKGDRHPTSVIENTVLEYNNPKKSLHRTQKPVELCEWLIKSYTNEGDLVCDFCMGSGTVGVACNNTKRQFIGIEKNDEIFEIAYNRINNINLSL